MDPGCVQTLAKTKRKKGSQIAPYLTIDPWGMVKGHLKKAVPHVFTQPGRLSPLTNAERRPASDID
jgi:hypothetical protein